jgi:hypothetical protein
MRPYVYIKLTRTRFRSRLVAATIFKTALYVLDVLTHGPMRLVRPRDSGAWVGSKKLEGRFRIYDIVNKY